jgi:hypothetical protein
VHELEEHIHASCYCFGNSGGNLSQDSLTAFQVTAGSPAGAWGTELQIHDGTVLSGVVGPKADVGRLFVATASAVLKNYIVQFWSGQTTFGAATFQTSAYVRVDSAAARASSVILPMPRIDSTDKIWVRSKSETANATLDFLIEAHGYPG